MHVTFGKEVAFCSCPKYLWETEFESDRLMDLVEETSRQSNIHTMAWYFQLLVLGGQTTAQADNKRWFFTWLVRHAKSSNCELMDGYTQILKETLKVKQCDLSECSVKLSE